MLIKAALLDLDGILVQTEKQFEQASLVAARNNNVSLYKDQFREKLILAGKAPFSEIEPALRKKVLIERKYIIFIILY